MTFTIPVTFNTPVPVDQIPHIVQAATPPRLITLDLFSPNIIGDSENPNSHTDIKNPSNLFVPTGKIWYINQMQTRYFPGGLTQIGTMMVGIIKQGSITWTGYSRKVSSNIENVYTSWSPGSPDSDETTGLTRHNCRRHIPAGPYVAGDTIYWDIIQGSNTDEITVALVIQEIEA